MKYRSIVVAVLWLIAGFAYAASVAGYFWSNSAKTVGVMAVVLLVIAALITRSKIYLGLYDRQIGHVATPTTFVLKGLSWALFFCTCAILTLHFSAPDGASAKSNNAFLSIFAFITFFSGRSLLLRPFQNTRS